MYGLIYKATNIQNGMSYVGQTTKTLHRRRTTHICSSRKPKTYFHNALRKYNEKEFEWSIIKECNNQNELNNSEIYYIKEYNTLAPNGYNLTGGGYKSPMINPSKETIKKHKKACKKANRKFKGKNNCMKKPEIIQKHKKAVNNKEKCLKQSKFMKINNPNKNPQVIKNKCKHDIYILSPLGIKYHVTNLKKFCRDNNLCYVSIRNRINHKIKKIDYKGWLLQE